MNKNSFAQLSLDIDTLSSKLQWLTLRVNHLYEVVDENHKTINGILSTLEAKVADLEEETNYTEPSDMEENSEDELSEEELPTKKRQKIC